MKIAQCLAILWIALTSACSSTSSAPGYDGALPSPSARISLQEIQGSEYSDAGGHLGGGTWTVGLFAVISNAASPGGKGPVVRLESGRTTKYVPLENDDDVAHFIGKVTGKFVAAGDLSEAYKSVWK